MQLLPIWLPAGSDVAGYLLPDRTFFITVWNAFSFFSLEKNLLRGGWGH